MEQGYEQGIRKRHIGKEMGRIPPPEVVATWPKPNYVNPHSRGRWIMSVEMVLLAFTLLVVSLRVYTRAFMIRSFGVDDWLIVAATIICTALTISTCLATIYGGYGLHMWDVKPQQRAESLKFAWANMLLFTICIGLTKLSILWFYLRLASTKIFRWATYGWIVFVMLWVLGFFIALCMMCIPLPAYWNPLTMDQSRCLDEVSAMVCNAVFNIIADLGLIVLPMPVVWRVQLPIKQRLGLLLMFGLGAIVCVAGFMRLKYLIIATKSMDPTWDGFLSWIWVAIECDVGIICASIPSLKPLVVKSRQTIRDYSSRSRNGGNNSITHPPSGNTEAKQSILNAPGKSKANDSKISKRLSKIIPGSNYRSHGKLDSVWDGADAISSEENIPGKMNSVMVSRSRSQSYRLNTTVNAERDEKAERKERKSLFMERIRGGSSSPEHLPNHKRGASTPTGDLERGVRVSVMELEDFKNVELRGRGSEDGLTGSPVSVWDVMKTTKIEVVSQTFQDGRPSTSERTLV